MVSNHEGFTNNSPRCCMAPTPVKKPSDRKSLYLFTKILDVKKKIAILWVRAAKSKRKTIKSGTTLWTLKLKRKVNPKINYQIKKFLYNWTMHHPQVVQSLNFNYCTKSNIDDHTEPQIVPIFLLQSHLRLWVLYIFQNYKILITIMAWWVF